MQEHIIRCECNAEYRSEVEPVHVRDGDGNVIGTRMRSRDACGGCGKRDAVQSTRLPSKLDVAQKHALDSTAGELVRQAIAGAVDAGVQAKMSEMAASTDEELDADDDEAEEVDGDQPEA